jgi:hypothetical protein
MKEKKKQKRQSRKSETVEVKGKFDIFTGMTDPETVVERAIRRRVKFGALEPGTYYSLAP